MKSLSPASVLSAALVGVVVAAGCARHDRAASIACPPGANLAGAPPPHGSELYCQKTVGGKVIKDGPYVVFADGGGKLIEGKYRDGVQEGQWTTWYENGQRSAVDTFHNGLQDGLHTSWYANGQKAIEGNYHAGKREGVWRRWDPGGFTMRQQTWHDDRAVP